MSKLTCLVLCAVAMCLSSVYVRAVEEEDASFHVAVQPFVIECAKELGISDADLKKSKETRNPDDITPCFLGCVFKKFEIMNDKGEYVSENNIAKMKKLMKNDDDFAILIDIAKKCESVNAQAVSDGDAGCERAVLLAKCFMEKKTGISI